MSGWETGLPVCMGLRTWVGRKGGERETRKRQGHRGPGVPVALPALNNLGECATTRFQHGGGSSYFRPVYDNLPAIS